MRNAEIWNGFNSEFPIPFQKGGAVPLPYRGYRRELI